MGHLNQELAGAENIKSRQTRQSVLSAITSTRESKSETRTYVIFRAETLQIDSRNWFGSLLWCYSDGRWQD